MKLYRIFLVLFLFIICFFAVFVDKTLAGETGEKLPIEIFDFYVYPKSSLPTFDCKISGVECSYNEAVVPGKKPSKKGATYIGTGSIDMKKMLEAEKELSLKRMTLFQFIDVELERSLSHGISAIQEQLLSNQQDLCEETYDKRNLHFKEMVTKLKKKINIELKKNGKTNDVIDGQKLLRKLQCSD